MPCQIKTMSGLHGEAGHNEGVEGILSAEETKSQGAPQKQAKPKNRFKNFDERSYDYAVLKDHCMRSV